MTSQDKDAVFSIVKCPVTNNVNILFLQTGSMRKVLAQYPDVIHLDGTYCINNLGYPVYVMMVSDGEGNGRVVAYALVQNETADTLTNLLTEFKNVNKDVEIKAFVVDKDAAEISAIKNVFPGVSVLLCNFHVTNNLKDASVRYSEKCPQQVKDDNLNALYCMLNTTKEEKFYECYNKLTPGLKTYMDKSWMGIKDSWAKAFTQHIISYGVRSNNIVERHNRVLKQHCRRTTNIPNLIRSFLMLNKSKECYKVKEANQRQLSSKILSFPEGTPESLVLAIQSVATKVTDKALNLLMTQVKQAVSVLKSEEEVVTEYGIYCLGEDGEKHTYDCSLGSCHCYFFSTNQLPCWHQMLYRFDRKEEIFPSIPVKWSVTNLVSVMSTPVDNTGVPRASVSKFEPSQKCLNDIQKRVKADEHLKSLLNVMVSCGTGTFNSRLAFIEHLETLWRLGIEVDASLEVKADEQMQQLVDDKLEESDDEIQQERDDSYERLMKDVDDIDGGWRLVGDDREGHLHQEEDDRSGQLQEGEEGRMGQIHQEEEDRKGQVKEGEIDREGQFQQRHGERKGHLQQGKDRRGEQKDDEVDITGSGASCTPNPPFKFAGKIKRKCRSPGQIKKVKQAAQRIFKVASLTGNPFRKVEQGLVTITEDEDEVDPPSTSMLVHNESESSVCQKCGNEQVDKDICSTPEFCETVKCEMCGKWFHAVCVTGNLKVQRGTKFRCHICCK